ncbi:hypothetical protein J4208_03495 [Candidatus Woesearchaeota archaeon]|nr:hypothetical protein [Candidatus Woesearchaeota archaeon]
MTIHCAISYFEGNSGGYLLGCDSTLQISRTVQSLVKEFPMIVEKSFRGAHFVGFIRGRLPSSILPTTPAAIAAQFSARLRSLDFCFDGIQQGITYTHPSLCDLSAYTLLIAKQQADHLELFNVSNQRPLPENNHRATRLHHLELPTLAAQPHSVVFYAPCTPNYLQFRFRERCNFVRAKKILEQLLTERSVLKISPQLGRYHPGKASLFAVDFTGIRQID